MGLKTLDLPPLYCDFDDTSVSSQRNYLRLIRADLAVLVLAAAVSSVSTTIVSVQRGLFVSGAIFLGAGLFITIILSRNAYEQTWYLGRASAETVKSLTWKYMMRAAPFTGAATSPDSDSAFLKDLTAILRERRAVTLSRKTIARAGEPITARMREVRSRGLQERLTFYVDERVQDQVRWYSSKSQYNDTRQERWFYGLIGIQFVAFVCAIFQIVDPAISFNYSSALAALATALLAWLQIKRHRELAQSYSVAAHELGIAAGLAAHVKTEEDLSQFVNDTESAVSREHTMWIARREAVG